MLLKKYILENYNFSASSTLSQLFMLSKSVKNEQNKNFMTHANPIIFTWQFDNFYQKKYNNLIFFRTKKFGYKDMLGYSIFKFDLFESQHLTDMYLSNNFLIKNLELTRYSLFNRLSGALNIQSVAFSNTFGVSWKEWYDLIIKYKLRSKYKFYRSMNLRIKQHFSFKFVKKLNRKIKAEIDLNKKVIMNLCNKKFKAIQLKFKKIDLLKKRLDYLGFKRILSFFYFKAKKVKYFSKPIRYAYQQHMRVNAFKKINYLEFDSYKSFYKNHKGRGLFFMYDTMNLKDFYRHQRLFNPSYFKRKGRRYNFKNKGYYNFKNKGYYNFKNKGYYNFKNKGYYNFKNKGYKYKKKLNEKDLNIFS